MDFENFKSEICDTYSGCDESTAEKIAKRARQYHSKHNSNNTAEDWLSIMTRYNQQDPIAAWNYAVGWADVSNFGGSSPYKID